MATIQDLPNEMLGKILEYIPGNERQSVAKVCTRFANVLEIPQFWQHQEFDFEDHLFTRRRRSELQYACRFQSHWKYLDLKFGRLTKRAADRFKKLSALLCREFIEVWKLERLTVNCGKRWHNETSKRIFVMTISPIFYHQSQLTEVNISTLLANHEQGCAVLRAILEGCGSSITTLRLVDFFRSYSVRFSDDFEILVTSFVNLHHLELNYNYVTIVLLHLLAVRFPGQLKTFTLRNSITNLAHDRRLSQAYIVLGKACPTLAIDCKLN